MKHQNQENGTGQQTNNFDIGEWFNKNQKMVIGIIGSAIILFGVYYIFLKHDPAKDGKDIAISFCNCTKKQTDEQLNIYEDFISNYESYKLNGRTSALSTLQSKLKQVNEESQKCQEKPQADYNKFKGRYITEKEKLEKFDFAFNAQQGLCQNENQTNFNEIYGQVQNLINQPLDYTELLDLQKSTLEKVSDLFNVMGWNLYGCKNYTLFTHGTNDNYHFSYNFNYVDGYDLYDIIYTMNRWCNSNGDQIELLQKSGHSNVIIYYTNSSQFDKLENSIKPNFKLFATKTDDDGERESFYRNGNIEIEFNKNLWLSSDGYRYTRHITYIVIFVDISDINNIKSK